MTAAMGKWHQGLIMLHTGLMEWNGCIHSLLTGKTGWQKCWLEARIYDWPVTGSVREQ